MKKYEYQLSEGEIIFCDYCQKLHSNITAYIGVSEKSKIVNIITCQVPKEW